MHTPETVPQLLIQYADRVGVRRAALWNHRGAWTGHNGDETLATTREVAAWLDAWGVERGHCVGLLMDTVPAWALLDHAILGLGAVTVGLYPTANAEQTLHILEHAEVRLVAVNRMALLKTIQDVWERLPKLMAVILVDDFEGLGGIAGPTQEEAKAAVASDARIVALSAVRAAGKVEPLAEDAAYRGRALAVRPEDLATIIYTSGTTGLPKGVMLSHANLTQTAVLTARMVGLRPDDFGVAFLPMAHSLQRVSAYAALAAGVAGGFAPSIERLPETWRMLKPTVQASVPRIWEKVYLKIQAGLQEASPGERRVFWWAHRVGDAVARAQREGRRPPLWARLAYPLADRLVFQKVRARFGGRVRFLTSGGAPISGELLRFFHALGILVLEGYGLTETSAPATMNTMTAYRFGTVGLPLPLTEIRIADDGEVLIKGPGVFSGYHQDPEATTDAFTDDGWFKSGDIGELDADGYLRITDRKKNLIVTAQGKNVAPANVEAAIKVALPFVSQVYIHGDERPYLVALLTLDPEHGADHGADHGAEEPERERIFEAGMKAANERLPHWEQVHRWEVLPAELTEAQGLLTPTLKLKRKAIAKHFADTIEALYRQPRDAAPTFKARASAAAAAIGGVS